MNKTARMMAAVFVAAIPAANVLAGEILSTQPLESQSRQETYLRAGARHLNRQTEEKFPLAEKLDPAGWYCVDLKPYCDMNLFSTAGTTCPVKFSLMPLGRQSFYGVPVEIIAPAENDNKTALTLPSKRVRVIGRLAVPEIAVGKKAAVLYFLMAGYYVRPEEKCGVEIRYADGTSHKLEIRGDQQLGDWYHASTRVYNDNARYVLVPAFKEGTLYRNLHVFQWVNPTPDKAVRSIAFQPDKEGEMAVFIVALTGHPGGEGER